MLADTVEKVASGSQGIIDRGLTDPWKGRSISLEQARLVDTRRFFPFSRGDSGCFWADPTFSTE
jgi:hypothetical protein